MANGPGNPSTSIRGSKSTSWRQSNHTQGLRSEDQGGRPLIQRHDSRTLVGHDILIRVNACIELCAEQPCLDDGTSMPYYPSATRPFAYRRSSNTTVTYHDGRSQSIRRPISVLPGALARGAPLAPPIRSQGPWRGLHWTTTRENNKCGVV